LRPARDSIFMTTAGIWRRQGPEESKDSSQKRLLTPPTEGEDQLTVEGR
jgi:hypothetical protein